MDIPSRRNTGATLSLLRNRTVGGAEYVLATIETRGRGLLAVEVDLAPVLEALDAQIHESSVNDEPPAPGLEIGPGPLLFELRDDGLLTIRRRDYARTLFVADLYLTRDELGALAAWLNAHAEAGGRRG